MGGILLLLGLCLVMALASFVAGALPLSFTLSNSQLRFLSSLGVGVLVGTSLIVIIPEGIGAVVSPPEGAHIHRVRTVAKRSPVAHSARSIEELATNLRIAQPNYFGELSSDEEESIATAATRIGRRDQDVPPLPEEEHDHEHEHENEFPSFEVGISLILGFVLMFLIDRLPKHATESLHPPPPTTHHVSLNDLSTPSPPHDEESAGLMGSLAPTPRKARTLATTLGLVIHAAADGIAMGASSSTEDVEMSFVIFMAIMIHKAPAAFGLTSVLLKQGLSKRAARGHLIVFSLAAPVGAVATWMLVTLMGGGGGGADSRWWTGMLLLFSGGTFLYVAMHAMQEDAHGHDHASGPGINGYAEGGASQRKAQGPGMRDTLATMGGMLLPLLTQFGHHHH